MINTPEDEEDERRKRLAGIEALRARLSARGEQEQTPVKPVKPEYKQETIHDLRARLARRGDDAQQQQEPSPAPVKHYKGDLPPPTFAEAARLTTARSGLPVDHEYVSPPQHTPRRQGRSKPVPKPRPAPHQYRDTDRPEQEFMHLCSGAELPRRRDGVLKHPGHFALWFALMGCDGTTVQDFYHNRENETQRESQVQNIVKCLDLVPEQVLMLVAEQLDDEQELIREGRIAKYPALPTLSYIGSKCLVAMSMDKKLGELNTVQRTPKTPTRRVIL